MDSIDRKVVKKIFANFPPTHAIPRANEALALKGFTFEAPVLDVGCGDGRFAFLTYGSKVIDVGLDGKKKFTKRALKNHGYQSVVTAQITNMPFYGESFETVIANSVMEHVEKLDLALTEINRVLVRDGKFILTVPTPLVSKYLFWSKIFPGYTNFKKYLWQHRNYFGEKIWCEKLKKTGFKIEEVRKTNGKAAIKLADIFFPLFIFGPIKGADNYFWNKNIFGESSDGATLIIKASKK